MRILVLGKVFSFEIPIHFSIIGPVFSNLASPSTIDKMNDSHLLFPKCNTLNE